MAVVGSAVPDKDSWLIVKWDFVFNLIVLGSYLLLRGRTIIAYIVYGCIFVFSLIAFKHRKPWVPIFFAIFSAAAFFWVWYYPLNDFEYFFRIFAWVLVVYTLFWIFNVIKNYIVYLRSLMPEICPFCNAEEDELLSHMGNRLCHQCFNDGVFSIQGYHDVLLNYWDYEFMIDLEQQLEKEIPCLGDETEKPLDLIYSDLYFGYIVKNRKITHLFLASQELTYVNLAIGSLNQLEILSLYNNRLAFLPGTIQSILSIKKMDLRKNNLDLSLSNLQQTLIFMRDQGCEILLEQNF